MKRALPSVGKGAPLSHCPRPVGLFRESELVLTGGCDFCQALGDRRSEHCTQVWSGSSASGSDLLSSSPDGAEEPSLASGDLRKGTGWGSVTCVPLKVEPAGSPSEGGFIGLQGCRLVRALHRAEQTRGGPQHACGTRSFCTHSSMVEKDAFRDRWRV